MKPITIPCPPIYWTMINSIEAIGLEVTDEIMSLCKQIEQELLKQAADDDTGESATYEWFMSLDKTAQTEWLNAVRSHDNPFFQTDQDIIDSLPKETA